MTRPTARDRTLDNLANRLDRAAYILPDIADHLAEQRSHITILAAQDLTAINGSSEIANPTLRITMLLDAVDLRQREIDDWVATLELAVKGLEQACRTALSYRVPAALDDYTPDADRPRCIGAGATISTRCDQIPTPRTSEGSTVDDGRCLDCGRRYDQAQLERRQARAWAERMRYHRNGRRPR